MTISATAPKRRLIVPEVVQTSKMDCGPACLKSLLKGFDIDVSYGRLREACQTDVDGTSIDTLEEIAIQLGLEAEQLILPVDHILLPDVNALPALIVTRLPSGFTHFVIVWRCHANRVVQIMDPAAGRRWLTVPQFLDQLYIHKYPVSAADWREWASEDEFIDPLRNRLANLGIKPEAITQLIESALSDPAWRPLAALDAATRMVQAMVRSGGIKRGQQATHVLRHFFKLGRTTPVDDSEPIPATYWFVYPTSPDFDEEEHLFLQGAVFVRVLGRVSERSAMDETADSASSATLSPELVAALEEAPVRPWIELLRLLGADGLLAPVALVTGLALAATGIVIEALLFRGLLDLGGQLATVEQRLAATAFGIIFVIANLLLGLYIDSDVRRFGRRLEARLRIAFLEKIPRLSDRYFRSRPISDMVERSHSIHKLRTLPDLGKRFIQSLFEVVLTTAGMIWLHPPGALVAILAAFFSVFVPLTAQPLLTELDLRLRTHLGGLGRYYLDTMLGLVAVRTHRAEDAIRRQHESLLAEWIRTKIKFLRLFITIEGVQIIIALACVIWIILDYITQEANFGSVLLLAYWGLNLMFRGRQVVYSAREYASQRNITLRLLEPLGAPEESHLPRQSPQPSDSPPAGGLNILMEGVSVRAVGHTILQNIHLKVEAGTHLAIVGPSGAGKTSLISLLLGWHRPATGRICIDNEPLDGQRLSHLRRETAWVDPAIQIWNRSFLDNLLYGTSKDPSLPFAQVIKQADLRQVLERLPEGLQTPLGEGGGLVSGGEGQRVRLGRAMLREGVRLVILDEPFRGLGRSQRRELLTRTRQLWSDVTLLCITHDVSETQGFERVLVMEEGQIVEDGNPTELAEYSDSRYRTMLNAEKDIHTELWGHQQWRQLWMQDGRLKEEEK